MGFCVHPQSSPYADWSVVAVYVGLIAAVARAQAARPTPAPAAAGAPGSSCAARGGALLFVLAALSAAGTSVLSHVAMDDDAEYPLFATGSSPAAGLASHLARAALFAAIAALIAVSRDGFFDEVRSSLGFSLGTLLGAVWGALQLAQVLRCGMDVHEATADARGWRTLPPRDVLRQPSLALSGLVDTSLTALCCAGAFAAARLAARRAPRRAARAGAPGFVPLDSPLVDEGEALAGQSPAFAGSVVAPEDAAGAASRLLVSWVWPMLRVGARRQLEQEDMPPLRAADAPAAWAARLAARLGSERGRPSPSIARALAAAYGAAFARVGLWRVANDALTLGAPLLLRAVVEAAQGARAAPLGLFRTRWGPPCEWGALLVLCTAAQAVTGTQFELGRQRLALRVRSGLVAAVFAQATSPLPRPAGGAGIGGEGGEGGGAEVNLATADAQKLMDACGSLHELWSLPVQVGVTLALLRAQVGPAFLAGLAVLALMVPVNLAVARRIGTLSRRMMRHKDDRVQAAAALVRQPRALRMAALSELARARLCAARAREFGVLAARKYLDALCVLFWAATPVLVTFSIFAAFALAADGAGRPLDAGRAFASLALVRTLIYGMNAFPWVLTGLVEARVAVGRLHTFLLAWPAAAAASAPVVRPPPPGVAAHARGDFAWPGGGPPPFALRGLDVAVPAGAFVAVCGGVGSGKSTLLRALCGHVPAAPGGAGAEARLPAAGVAFAPHRAWVRRGTVLGNVAEASGDVRPDEARARAALEAAALWGDVRAMPAGVHAEVGDSGSTLSGGQRQRLGLARALYCARDCPLAVLDDPTSALDEETARAVFARALGPRGALAGRARVVATHAVHLAAEFADEILVMRGGAVVERGAPAALAAAGGPFAALLATHRGAQDGAQSAGGDGERGGDAAPPPVPLPVPPPVPSAAKCDDAASGDNDDAFDAGGGGGGRPGAGPEALAAVERREAGHIRWSVLRSFLAAVGAPAAAGVLLFLAAMQGTRNGCDWWVGEWSGGEVAGGTGHFLRVYAALAAANFALTLLRAFSFAWACLRAAHRLHDELARAVFAAPLSFFDATPVGRLLNRFSGDVLAVDEQLPFQLNIFLAQAAGLAGTVAVIVAAVWPLLALAPPVAVAYAAVQRVYRASARELRRLDAVSRSPLLAGFEAAVGGRAVLSAAGPRALREHARRNLAALEAAQRAFYGGFAAAQWLGARLQLMGSAVVAALVAVAAAEIAAGGGLAPHLLGLALAYALPIVGSLAGLLASGAETEKEMVAVERLAEYAGRGDAALLRDAVGGGDGGSGPGGGDGVLAGAAEAAVEVRGLRVRYRASLPPAVAVDRLSVATGRWLAVCGRTGSGKSTLAAALARVVPFEGEVAVAGFGAARGVAGDWWRRRWVCAVPQEAAALGASVREAVDPTGRCADEAVAAALDACGASAALGLRDPGSGATDVGRAVEEAALSAGQRQLLCAARGMLAARPRGPAGAASGGLPAVVLIDEATAQMGAAAEATALAGMRRWLRGATVLLIAHRASAVRTCEEAVVVEGGRVAERGETARLLADPGSRLSALLSDEAVPAAPGGAEG